MRVLARIRPNEYRFTHKGVISELFKDDSGMWHETSQNIDSFPDAVYGDDDLFDEAVDQYERGRATQTSMKGEGDAGSIYFNDDDKHTNDSGGIQTKLPVRLDLIPPQVLLEVGKVLADGADKYGENNWQLIKTNDHLNHALTHIIRYLTGDRSEPHMVHALCRLFFAHYTSTNTEGN